MTSQGNEMGALRYHSYGQTRLETGSVPTDKRFTGQILDQSSGLYYYGARYYDAGIGRFAQPDSIVPQPGNPQSLNRYSYGYNNPVKYRDPSGHRPIDLDDPGYTFGGPPEEAVVISVDEKPHIQALERAQGWLRLPNGRAVTGFSHGYKRHGTTTLFAALEVATGMVRVGHYQRRRRREFLDFMNDVVKAYPDQEIHVILDNLSTHNPKRDRWRASHPRVHFHFTPTYASWLNQVEIWFSILARSALQGTSFTSPRQVREAIDAFLRAHNANAAPFEWTKQVAHAKGLKKSIVDL